MVAHFLDHVDLVRAGVGQDDVEFGLLFNRSSSSSSRTSSHHDGATSGRLDAVLVFQDGFQFLCLKKGQTNDLFGEFVQISHFHVPFVKMGSNDVGSTPRKAQDCSGRSLFLDGRQDARDVRSRRANGPGDG